MKTSKNNKNNKNNTPVNNSEQEIITGKCDKVKYIISRNGKKGKYITICRFKNKWYTVAQLTKENILPEYFSELEGEKFEYQAKIDKITLLNHFNLEVNESVKKAYDEGIKERNEIKKAKEKRENEIVKNGKEKYINTASEKAGKRFDKIVERVNERNETK